VSVEGVRLVNEKREAEIQANVLFFLAAIVFLAGFVGLLFEAWLLVAGSALLTPGLGFLGFLCLLAAADLQRQIDRSP
jgi:hypothetical protein